jgi:hypothetical protein
MRNFAWKPLFYLGGMIAFVFAIVQVSNHMLKIGYQQLADQPPDWPGSVTGGACRKDSDCKKCGRQTLYLPPGLSCQCLPKFSKCGIGRRVK